MTTLNDDIASLTDECYRCGYDLRGIEDDQPCPECGLLAQRSRRTTDELHDTRPRWLRSISRGANLILAAIVFAFAWTFAHNLLLESIVVPMLWKNTGPRSVMTVRIQRFVYDFPYLGYELAAAMLGLGAFFLTRREDYPPADRADRPLRVALRWLAMVPLASLVLLHVSFDYYMSGVLTGRSAADLEWLQPAAMWLAALAGIPLPVLLFFRLRSLARRARSAHLAEHCAIVGIGTSCAVLYLVVTLVILAHADEWGWGTNWSGRSRVALGLIVAIATAAFLFTFWSLYLLIRFAIAFRRASKQLKHKWTRDDRAAAVTAS